MKYLFVGVIGFILSASVFAVPVELERVLIVEIQAGSLDSVSEEFVELHNPNDVELDLVGWVLEKKSATGSSWTTKAELTGVIEPRGRYLISSAEEYLVEEQMDFFTSPGLAASGGHVRLVEPVLDDEDVEIETIIHDTLGWGSSANEAEGDKPTDAPNDGESLKRIVDEDGYFIDTDINFDDFEISIIPSPVTDELLTEEDILIEDTDDDEESELLEEGNIDDEETEEELSEVAGITTAPKTYSKIHITELFIDPGKPKTDADDEFIELFNPNKASVQLEGYVIQTGNTFSRSFTIPQLEIKTGQYLALYSVDTGLPLANTGSQARILDPNGDEVYKTTAYDKAKTDIAWALVAGKWQWTATPTPAAPNVIVAPASSSRKKSSSSSQSSSSRKSSSGSSSDARIIYEEPAAITDTEINKAVLIGVGALALGYAVYEYRHDIANRYHQSKRYIKSRR